MRLPKAKLTRGELALLKKKKSRLHQETKKSILGVFLLGLTVLFILGSAGKAGPAGQFLYRAFENLFGIGYYLLPIISFAVAIFLLFSHERKFLGLTLLGAFLFVLTGLGFIDLVAPGRGGLAGTLVGTLEAPFGRGAAIVVVVTLLIVSLLLTFNTPLKLRRAISRDEEEDEEEVTVRIPETSPSLSPLEDEEKTPQEEPDEEPMVATPWKGEGKKAKAILPPVSSNYIFPPLELLKSAVEKPTPGDLRANANIIKRTLESFGIPVEMGEINIGPKVTRYTLKPAEGVKLTKIIALNQDLALALAAHPIRIEAPIPGKSLVGIEVPNKQVAVVRLGSLVSYEEFQKADPLSFVLGRNVSGEPVFTNIEKMPHLLIAGATGSGKSVMIHSLLISLLYKNSPEMLRFILIDPKRVELTSYEGIPHLVAPVITESKKTIAAFKWAIHEMERRYEVLLKAGARDIKSYNKQAEEKLPYLIIVIDELADLMATYGREIEGFIVRLAQMARATGIHLILSTQRPSVEVITGLIKANITARIALQVASQIDSRTILDVAGAEKLLGGGDLLYISSDYSKPHRVQGAFISDEEIRAVTHFIREKNPSLTPSEIGPEREAEAGGLTKDDFFDGYDDDGDEDELYEEAKRVVAEAGKASASLLQRRLKVGYARAARLLDILEAKGIIGPGDGAKPREVYWSGDEPPSEELPPSL